MATSKEVVEQAVRELRECRQDLADLHREVQKLREGQDKLVAHFCRLEAEYHGIDKALVALAKWAKENVGRLFDLHNRSQSQLCWLYEKVGGRSP